MSNRRQATVCSIAALLLYLNNLDKKRTDAMLRDIVKHFKYSDDELWANEFEAAIEELANNEPDIEMLSGVCVAFREIFSGRMSSDAVADILDFFAAKASAEDWKINYFQAKASYLRSRERNWTNVK
jgi:hypothetical protein